ncbi:MAG: TolC family protein [Planctomycetes bacterium]|nr:TolC family protein [Planctomycetota bacterium]
MDLLLEIVDLRLHALEALFVVRGRGRAGQHTNGGGRRETRQAFVGARDQLDHLELSERSAGRSLELSRIQYEEGSSTFTRVLDAQAQLLAVQDTLVLTQGDVAQSLISTYKALGGGWEIRQGMDILPEETREEMEERTDWDGMLDPDYASGSDLLIPRHDPSRPLAEEEEEE